MYGAITEQGSDKLMQRYGQIYRENKQACEHILGELPDSDLEWLRRHAWQQAQREQNV
jgi:hypothetical protein